MTSRILMSQRPSTTNETLAGSLWNETPENDTESFSTNDTADNLIGPGRTLGVIYNCLGRYVESSVNKLAEKMKLGPKATYSKIEEKRLQLLGDSATSLQDVDVPQSTGKQLRKYMKALLKYAQCAKNSNVISTQMAALEYIITLATNDRYFRAQFEILESEVLLRQNYDELLTFEYNSKHDTTLLQSRSRKALIAVSEVDIGCTLSVMKNAGILQPEKILCYSKLLNFLRDANVSFIAARRLAEYSVLYIALLPTLQNHDIDLFGALNDFIFHQVQLSDDLLAFEWESLDKILAANMDLYQRGNSKFPTIKLYMIRLLFCYAEKLPLTIEDQNRRLNKWLGHVTSMMADITIVRSPKIMDSLPWLITNALSGKNLAKLSRTERQSLRSSFSQNILSYIWKTTLQRPYAVLYSICSNRYVQYLDPDVHGYITMEKVAEPETIREMCMVLGRLCYSKSTKTRKLAVEIFHLVGRLDRYCQAAALQGLERATDSHSYALHVEKLKAAWHLEVLYAFVHPSISESKGPKYLIIADTPHGPIYCTTCKGNIEGIECFPDRFDGIFMEIGNGQCTMLTPHLVGYLFVQRRALIWLEVPAGRRFWSKGHCAVRAGRMREGEQVYVAAPLPRKKTANILSLSRDQGSNSFIYHGPMAKLGTVADGDDSVLMEYEDGTQERLKDFCVLVYRYDFYKETEWHQWKGCVGCAEYRQRK